jgi:hypothetical protein
MNAAEKIRYDEATMSEATVVAREAGMVVIRAEGRVSRAKQAASCLLAPEEGDRVLVAWLGDERFVLAVLERSGASPSRVEIEGDLEVRVPHGRFTVASQDGIDLTTAGETSIVSRVLSMHALEGNVMIDKLRALGSTLTGEVSRMRIVAESVDSIVERVHQRWKRAYRFIEEREQVKAKHLDYRAEQTARVHAENTVVTANDLVKLDGKQVHIG